MKKFVVLLLYFGACESGSRTYVNRTAGPYSIAYDTLIIQNDLIINRSGFQKIRDGKALPKKHNIKQWRTGEPDAPVIRIDGKHAFWNNTIYRLLP